MMQIKTIAEATGEDGIMMVAQIRGPDGTETEVGTGTDARGGTKTATSIEYHTDRIDRETTDRTAIDGATRATWTTTKLKTEVEEDESPIPERPLDHGRDHLAAGYTRHVNGHAHLVILFDARHPALEHHERLGDDQIAQRLTQTLSKLSSALFYPHLNLLSARAAEAHSKPIL